MLIWFAIMESSEPPQGSYMALYLGLAAVVLAVLHQLLQYKPDPREPPVIYPRIPYVGHAIGMLLRGKRYIRTLEYAL